MNNNRKILCGAAALLVSAGFFGASFLIPELSEHINPTGQWKSACLCCHVIDILPGISGGHASDRTVGDRHMSKQKK